MGIDYDGKLIVGGDYDDVAHLIPEDCEDEYDVLGGLGLDWAFPYFDCCISDCTVGYALPDLPLNDPKSYEVIKEYAERWEGLTGKEALLIGTQHIY